MAHDLTESAQDSVALAQRRRGQEAVAPESDLYAALDLGTNSCRMLIATPEAGRFRVVDAFAKSVRLGVGAGADRASVARGDRAHGGGARHLRREARALRGDQHVRLVATEACRRARNGNHFLTLVARETGLRLEVIRPEEEARLAVISCAPLVSPRPSSCWSSTSAAARPSWSGSTCAGSPRENGRRRSSTCNERRARGPVQARIVDFISVPLGVATLHDRYSDVADDSARFALMSWFFEEQIADFTPYLETPTGPARGVPDDRHLAAR